MSNDGKPVRSWQEIAEEASHELDPIKLQQLSEELTLALEERDKKPSLGASPFKAGAA